MSGTSWRGTLSGRAAGPEVPSLGLWETVAGLALAGGALLAANLLSRRPYVPGRPPLVPYVWIEILAALAALLLAAHLVSLVTGTPLVGRWQR